MAWRGGRLTREQALSVIGTASLAPSARDSRPWRLRLLPDRIEAHADPDRALPVTDPVGRELRLSCGAALYDLRLALKCFGVRPLVTLLPGPASGALTTSSGWATCAPHDPTTKTTNPSRSWPERSSRSSWW